jgi:hypothetical protein
MSQLYIDQISPTNPTSPVNIMGPNKPTYLGNPLLPGISGGFTCPAAAYIDLNISGATSTSKILLYPTNAPAVTLTLSNKALIPTIKAEGQVRLSTAAGGNMVGTETFDYVILN